MNDKLNPMLGLILALARATSWSEPHRKKPGEVFHKFFAYYPYTLIDELERMGYVRTNIGSKKIELTAKGFAAGGALYPLWWDAFNRREDGE